MGGFNPGIGAERFANRGQEFDKVGMGVCLHQGKGLVGHQATGHGQHVLTGKLARNVVMLIDCNRLPAGAIPALFALCGVALGNLMGARRMGHPL